MHSTSSLVEAINDRYGFGLAIDGRADLGETAGATYVRWPDGRRSVVTSATVPLERMQQTAEVLNGAADQGLPVPRHEVVVEVRDQVVVVQERVTGRHPDRVDPSVVDVVIAANDQLAGVLADHPEVPTPLFHLSSSGPDFPRHETLAEYSSRSRRLLDRIRAIGADHADRLIGTDLVHPDLTIPNVLFDDRGRVTGLLDWNDGAVRGDRDFALVKLLFDLTWDAAEPDGGRHHIQPAALGHLHQRLVERLEPRRLKAYWAHWTLVMLHWRIRAGDHRSIDLHLELGEAELT